MYVVKHIAAIEMKLINGKDICEKVKEIQLGRIAIGALDAVHLLRDRRCMLISQN